MFLYSVFNEHCELSFAGGDDGIRTHDPLLAGQVLSQLSYTPKVIGNLLFLRFCAFALVGPSGLEPPTSCLSGTRSNLLSYDPMWLGFSVDLTRGLSVVGTVCAVPITDVSIELSSRTVSRKVFSPLQSLTSVFGMGTGGPSAFVTLTSFYSVDQSVTEN